MELKKLEVINFRNFENCSIDLTNKNLIFGMNDVGKSNLLYAIRMLFDSRIRNIPIQITDFHKRNIDNDIQISCSLESSDDSDESNLLRAKVENACIDDKKLFQIKLTCKYNDGDPNIFLKWGTKDEALLDIPNRGIRSKLDDVFHCVFIPSQNNTTSSFKDFKKELLNSHDFAEADIDFLSEIRDANNSINDNVAKLSSVKSMQMSINDKLSIFDNRYTVKISANHTFGDLHNNLDIFMQDVSHNEDEIYPTSGDGRIRKVMYAIISYLLQEGRNAQGKIPLLLIEEPENHLFLSAQVELSKAIFDEEFNPYLFLITHSPHLFYRISNEANLIRLFNQENKVVTKSKVANVPEQYQNFKNILLENLAQCLFVDKVLLVEGESEKLLFEWVLDKLGKSRENVLIQSILGINFERYVEILTGLGVEVLIKTDNDIKKNRISDNNTEQTYSAIGFNRCVKLINIKNVDAEVLKIYSHTYEPEVFRAKVFEENNAINQFKQNGIYLSKIDLEHDLVEALNFKSCDEKKLISWLQKAKWQNMWHFITRNEDEIPSDIYKELSNIDDITQMIYQHENFVCLKNLVNDE